MKNIILFVAIICSTSAFAQETPKVDVNALTESDQPNRITSKKKFFAGINLLAGISSQRMTTGVYNVEEQNSADSNEIFVGPGGGGGLELVVGRDIESLWRVSAFTGFQVSNGSPRTKDAKINFQRFYVGALLGIQAPVSKKLSFGVEAGGICQYGSKMHLKLPTQPNSSTLNLSYKTSIGSVLKASGCYSISKTLDLDFGFRYHMLVLEIKDVKINDNEAVLTSRGEGTYSTINGDGGTFYCGVSYRF